MMVGGFAWVGDSGFVAYAHRQFGLIMETLSVELSGCSLFYYVSFFDSN